MNLLLLANVASTWALVGLIWVIQLVHYPLFGLVGREMWSAYEAAHQTQITLLVLPLMLVELATSFLMAADPPKGVPTWATWFGLGLVGVAWLSTAFIQVPLHGQLSLHWDTKVHQALVATNWIRTAAWSAHGALVLWFLARVFEAR
ncbi:MAG: hypothetical protein OHK0023_00710 [Anaerolineae bacterium]